MIKTLKSRIQLYSEDLLILNRVLEALKKKFGSDVLYIRLRPIVSKIDLRKNYHGEGYSTYTPYGYKIHRATVTLREISLFQVLLDTCAVEGLALNARIA